MLELDDGDGPYTEYVDEVYATFTLADEAPIVVFRRAGSDESPLQARALHPGFDFIGFDWCNASDYDVEANASFEYELGAFDLAGNFSGWSEPVTLDFPDFEPRSESQPTDDAGAGAPDDPNADEDNDAGHAAIDGAPDDVGSNDPSDADANQEDDEGVTRPSDVTDEPTTTSAGDTPLETPDNPSAAPDAGTRDSSFADGGTTQPLAEEALNCNCRIGETAPDDRTRHLCGLLLVGSILTARRRRWRIFHVTPQAALRRASPRGVR